jgi:ATP-dependent DNA ligase
VSRIRQFISLILLPLLFSDVTAQESVWHGRCVGVTDGDTIKVLTAAKQQIRVRLAFVKRCQWVKPVLVAQVKFTEWTLDDQLRQPVFLGLRTDKEAKEIVRE